MVFFDKYYNAIKYLKIKSINEPTKEIYRTQLDLFITKLSSIIENENLSESEIDTLGPQYFIRKFFNTDTLLYLGCEEVVYCIAVASVKHSCESILESFVSRYEVHFDQRRNLGSEEAINEEFAIAVNGPNIAQCDNIIKEAMDKYWQESTIKWHFFRVSDIKRTKFKFTSKVLSKISKQQNSLTFMN